MTVAIVYETLEGQTGKIAGFVEGEVYKTGQDVMQVDTADKTAEISFQGIDKVILAAPVHERRHPKAFEVFVSASRHELKKCKTMMISVSLSAAFPEGMEEAREYLIEMEMRTGFKPDVEALVAGAVKPSGYDYFQAQVVRHNILLAHDHDLTEGEQEFTNWRALEQQLSAFLGGNGSST